MAIDKGLQFVINVFRRELAFLYEGKFFMDEEAAAIAKIIDQAQIRQGKPGSKISRLQQNNRKILDDILTVIDKP